MISKGILWFNTILPICFHPKKHNNFEASSERIAIAFVIPGKPLSKKKIQY